MLAITPTNQYSGVLAETVLHTIVFRACIGGQTRTDNLMIPDHGFYQLKYSYILSIAEVLKSFPVASHGESFIPPSASNILQRFIFLLVYFGYPVIYCGNHYFDKPYCY